MHLTEAPILMCVKIYCNYDNEILIVYIIDFSTGFSLSPIGVTYTCPRDQALLTCVTLNGIFLEWSITSGNYFRQRLISTSEIRDIHMLKVNHTTFRFVRESVIPLRVTLFAINTTVDWRISCTEYLLSDTQNTLECTIHIITMNKSIGKFFFVGAMYYINSSHCDTIIDLITVQPSFGESSITLTVIPERIQSMIHGLTYGAILTSSFGETKQISDGNDTSIELIALYNVQYNLTTFTALCEYSENQSETFTMFYSEFD